MAKTKREIAVEYGVSKDQITPFLKEMDRVARQNQRSIASLKRETNKFFSDATSSGLKFLGVIGSGFFALRKVLNIGDELKDFSQQTGISTDTLQEFRYVAGQTGADFEKLQKGMERFRASLTLASGQKAFELLGIKDLINNASTVDEKFNIFIKTLNGISDPVARQQAAIDVFGKKIAIGLIPILAQGNEQLARMRKNAHDIGAVLSTADIEKIDHITDKMKELGRRIIVTFFKFSEKSGLITLLENLIRLTADFIDGLSPERLAYWGHIIKWITEALAIFTAGVYGSRLALLALSSSEVLFSLKTLRAVIASIGASLSFATGGITALTSALGALALATATYFGIKALDEEPEKILRPKSKLQEKGVKDEDFVGEPIDEKEKQRELHQFLKDQKKELLQIDKETDKELKELEKERIQQIEEDAKREKEIAIDLARQKIDILRGTEELISSLQDASAKKNFKLQKALQVAKIATEIATIPYQTQATSLKADTGVGIPSAVAIGLSYASKAISLASLLKAQAGAKNAQGFAEGGIVGGSGGAKSDDQIIRASSGEVVVSNAQRSWLEDIASKLVSVSNRPIVLKVNGTEIARAVNQTTSDIL